MSVYDPRRPPSGVACLTTSDKVRSPRRSHARSDLHGFPGVGRKYEVPDRHRSRLTFCHCSKGDQPLAFISFTPGNRKVTNQVASVLSPYPSVPHGFAQMVSVPCESTLSVRVYKAPKDLGQSKTGCLSVNKEGGAPLQRSCLGSLRELHRAILAGQ